MIINDLKNVRDILGTRIISGVYNSTIADVNFLLKCDTSGGAVTINMFNISLLPTNSAWIGIVDDNANAGTNNITINPFAGQTINGNASIVLDQNNSSTELSIIDNDKWLATVTDLSDFNGVLPITKGGTGATNLTDAGINLSSSFIVNPTTSAFSTIATGDNLVYTVPTGKTLIVTNVIVYQDTYTGPGNGPSISMGTNPATYNNIKTNTNMTALNSTTKYYLWNNAGISIKATSGELVYVRVNGTAGAVAHTIRVFIEGYLV